MKNAIIAAAYVTDLSVAMGTLVTRIKESMESGVDLTDEELDALVANTKDVNQRIQDL